MRYAAKFTATPEDIVTGYRMRHRHSDDTWKLCLFGAALLLVIFGVAAYLMDDSLIFFVGACTAPAPLFPLLMEWDVRRRAKKTPWHEVQFWFSEEGVEFSSRTLQVKHDWSLIPKASVDERGLLLHTDEINCAFIPSRAFTSGYFPRQELKELLARKLK